MTGTLSLSTNQLSSAETNVCDIMKHVDMFRCLSMKYILDFQHSGDVGTTDPGIQDTPNLRSDRANITTTVSGYL